MGEGIGIEDVPALCGPWENFPVATAHADHDQKIISIRCGVFGVGALMPDVLQRLPFVSRPVDECGLVQISGNQERVLRMRLFKMNLCDHGPCVVFR